MSVTAIDLKIIQLLRKYFLPVARAAIFVVFFWFGALKLFDVSAAGPLATAVASKTIGLEHFGIAFQALGLFECVIGVLFLFPKMTRIVIPLLLIHLIIVSSPLVLVPDLTWTKAFVPALEGQYIIKNVLVIALAIGIASQVRPLNKSA